MIDIRPIQFSDAAQLLLFELANRRYFERWIAGRGDDFYQLHVVEHALKKAEVDRLAGRSFQYLIFIHDQIAGRINLTDVARGTLNKASLGFRIGESFTQRGIASEAIEFVLFEAFTVLNFWRIEAMVRPDNVGSLKALQKNGFHAFGRSTRSLQLNGHWHDLIHLERHADGFTPEISRI